MTAPERDIPPERETPEDVLAAEEAEAAAEEAAQIGGDVPPEDEDPARAPLAESGEGEAEGFELAEKDLEDIASHGDQHRFPDSAVGSPEEPQRAEYGEPDEELKEDA